MLNCPDTNKLSGLIKGDLPVDEMDSLTNHLDTCNGCQQTIQTIAAGQISIENLVAAEKMQPNSDSAYWKAIDSLERENNATREFNPKHSESNLAANSDFAVANTGIAGSTHDPAPISPRDLSHTLSFLEPSDDPAFIGKLHHFQIANVIGRGGMGIVLEGFDTHLHRRVAIKVLNPQYQENDIARQRFCREGRAAAAISHEHVVPMYHVAKSGEGKIAYLVMQLIEGETLEDRMRKESPMAPAEVARIGMQIAAGLSAAHASGMVHRDIKPANVLIESSTNRVKLTDFGLARAGDEVKLTQTGLVAGTPMYMSPEQALGDSYDERSDLFSLGAVMYEMATGSSPFAAPTAVGVMKRIMDEIPRSPHLKNPLISKPFSQLIMQLLAKKPDNRPNSAAAVAHVLANIVTEFGPISPLQVPAVASTEVKKLSGSRQGFRTRKTILGWTATALAVFVLGMVASFWMYNLGDRAVTDLAKNNDGTVELKNGLSTNKWSAETFPSIVLAGNSGTVWSVDFSLDGKYIAAAIEDGSVRLWDIENQEVKKSFNAHRGMAWTVRFHPTRDLVASTGDDGMVKLWNGSTFELVREWAAENAVRATVFSPDGSRLLAGDRDGKIHIYDIDSGVELATHLQAGSIFGIDYSSDGKLIATVGNDKVVRVFDAESFEERQTLTGHDGPIYNVAFAPKGPLLATVGWNKNIRIWNVETGAEVNKLEGSEGDIWGVSFCGSSDHLITGGQDGAARIWDLSDGSNVAILRSHSSSVHNIALDPGSHRIATGSRDGTIRIWDMSALQD